MREGIRILVFAGILALCFKVVNLQCCASAIGSQIEVDTTYFPEYYFSGGELAPKPMLAVHVSFYFNMSTVPINVSLPAFDPELFHYARYNVFAPFSRFEYALSLECSFSKDANETMADMVAQEFGRVFNCTAPPVPDQSGPVISNDTVVYQYDLGNLTCSLGSMKSLFKYDDNRTGFASLVDNFLEADPEDDYWVHNFYYILSRTSSGYSWELWISSDRNYDFSVGGLYAMSLNEMLNNTGGSLTSCETGSLMVLTVDPNYTANPRQICIQEVYSMSPLPSYSDEYHENRRYVWELMPSQRVDDLVFTLNLTVTSMELPQNALPGMLILIAAPVVGLAVGFVLVLGWRRLRNRSGFELAGVMGTSSGVVYLAGGMFAFVYFRVIERFGYTRTEYPYLQYSGILLAMGIALLIAGIAFVWWAKRQPPEPSTV